ncbi:MAG: hypothetical protein ABIF88_00085 [archaeon]
MVAKKNEAKRLKKFLLVVPEEVWNKWKDTVPRSISLNKSLIELLKKEGQKDEK